MSINIITGKMTPACWSRSSSLTTTLGKSSAELWDEAESQRLHKPVRQMRGKSSAELWDEAESQRLHKPIRQMQDPETNKPPEDNSLSPTKVALMMGGAAALSVYLLSLSLKKK